MFNPSIEVDFIDYYFINNLISENYKEACVKTELLKSQKNVFSSCDPDDSALEIDQIMQNEIRRDQLNKLQRKQRRQLLQNNVHSKDNHSKS